MDGWVLSRHKILNPCCGRTDKLGRGFEQSLRVTWQEGGTRGSWVAKERVSDDPGLQAGKWHSARVRPERDGHLGAEKTWWCSDALDLRRLRRVLAPEHNKGHAHGAAHGLHGPENMAE